MKNINQLLRDSLLATEGPGGDIPSVLNWINWRKKEMVISIEKIPFAKMSGWRIVEGTQNFVHETGKFFSIEGLRVSKDDGDNLEEWSQPIINQPEIGILGIIAKVIDGNLCFLLQAKIEPGNISGVQLSPTLQATRSNYMRAHGGLAPKYLEYFNQSCSVEVLIDQLQSEQGSRFLGKRNRNIIVLTERDVEEDINFIWLTLGQIKQLIKLDNTINMDTRSVISALNIEGIHHDIGGLSNLASNYKTMRDILSWLAFLKTKYSLRTEQIPLGDAEGWNIGSDQIIRDDSRYFKIFGIKALIEGREVKEWCQPIFQPLQLGLCAFIVKKINGIPHFLAQAKMECGNFDIVEIAPTVQCLTGGFEQDAQDVKFLNIFLSKKYKKLLLDVMQSEEGGRFYQEQNRNIIVEVGDDFSLELPENYTWLSYSQMMTLMQFNNYLNVQARSLMACCPNLVN